MAKTALKITATNAQTGDKITTNISDVNNSATSTQIRTLAQKLNALTTNEYEQADAVKTINVDTETIKAQPTLAYQSTAEKIDDTTYRIPFTYTGNGTLYINVNPSKLNEVTQISISKETGYITMNVVEGTTDLIMTYCLATETDEYYSCGLARSIAIG